MSINMENIRNIAICGHSSTGKTTFTEQLLFLGGSIAKPEKVENGKTVSDFTDEEIAQQISIHTSCSHLNWQDNKVNILDTPGASDFIGEVTAAFRATESALLLVGADAGVQIGTINLWRQLDRHALPRMIFLNKMDKADWAVLENLGFKVEKKEGLWWFGPVDVFLKFVKKFRKTDDLDRKSVV